MTFKNKKVLVTGACGFIGSHLVECLIDQGCSVKAFVFYNPHNSWGCLENISKQKKQSLEIILGDIRDPHFLNKAVKNMDIVFHLAALIGIPYSYHSPDSYLDTNIKGTLNILEACKSHSIERLVVTSSSEVYGSALYTPMDEKHPLQAQSPYAASKIAADKLAESFYLSFDLPVIIARPFNTYGPRQSSRAIIPSIISQILSGGESIKLGNLSPMRDFNYVTDICRGLLELVSAPAHTLGRTFNICTNNDISIKELATLILDLMHSSKKIQEMEDRKRPIKSEVNQLRGDPSLIQSVTHWKSQYTLKEGLRETIQWFTNKENLAFYKSDIFNL